MSDIARTHYKFYKPEVLQPGKYFEEFSSILVHIVTIRAHENRDDIVERNRSEKHVKEQANADVIQEMGYPGRAVINDAIFAVLGTRAIILITPPP